MGENVRKLIHVVHSGGGPLSAERQGYVASFRKHNPDYEIWLWWDPQRLLLDLRNKKVKEKLQAKHASVSKTAKTWKAIAKKTGQGLDEPTAKLLIKKYGVSEKEIEDVWSDAKWIMKTFCKDHTIEMKPLDDLGHIFNKDLALHELYLEELSANPVRGTNYGASSDILRIAIVAQHGGIYVDTDIVCQEPLGDIWVRRNVPRFSVGNMHECIGKSATGLTKAEWEGDDYWMQRWSGGSPPILSNSIIAAHAGSAVLQDYKTYLVNNYATARRDKTLVADYAKDFRTTTIRLTGPTAAAGAARGYKGKRAPSFGERLADLDAFTGDIDADKKKNVTIMKALRDEIMFPMYKVIDVYGHDWLKQ